MSKNSRATKRGRVSKQAESYLRSFIGFRSTQPPKPHTLHEYEAVNGTNLVRHRDQFRELQIVMSVLEDEAKTDKKWGSWRALVKVLCQFSRESTHNNLY